MDMKRCFLCLSMITVLALAGCSGKAKLAVVVPPPVVLPMSVSLSEVRTDGFSYVPPAATAGTPLEIAVGGMARSGDVEFLCTVEDCMVTVDADGLVTSTGGTVTAKEFGLYSAALVLKIVELPAMPTNSTLVTYMVPGVETFIIPAGGNPVTRGDVSFLCAPGGRACRVTVDADGVSRSEGGLVTASNSPDYITRIDMAAKAAMAAMAVETKKAIAISDAIEATGVVSNESGYPFFVDVKKNSAEDPMITLYDSNGSRSVMFDPKYAKATGVTTPGIEGWYGETLTRSTTTTGTDLVTIYTDIKNSTPNELTSDGSSVNSAGALIALNLANAENAVTLNNTTPPDLAHLRNDKFMGTFQGHAGEFTCVSSTGCTVTLFPVEPGRTANNIVSAIRPASGSVDLDEVWSFKSTNHVDSAAIQDNDYLVFGYWLNEDNNSEYTFTPIFDGGTPFLGLASVRANTTFSKTDSEATYTGVAGGRYVERTLNVDKGALNTISATEGQFTANASLTAYFGQSTGISQNLHNTISGKITDFKDGDKDLRFYVELNPVAFNNDASFSSGAVDAKNGTTEAKGGAWAGQFFGPGTATLPTGVAGEFEANFSDGNVAGAFGATKD